MSSLGFPLMSKCLNALVGRPNIGKTAFLLDLANRCVKTENKVVFLSLKNSAEMLQEKLNNQVKLVANPFVTLSEISEFTKSNAVTVIDDAWNIDLEISNEKFNDFHRRNEIVRTLAKYSVSFGTVMISWPVSIPERDIVKVKDLPLQLSSDCGQILSLDFEKSQKHMFFNAPLNSNRDDEKSMYESKKRCLTVLKSRSNVMFNSYSWSLDD